MKEILKLTYFGNTILDYLISFLIILLSLLAIKIIKSIVLKKFKKWAEITNTNFDDFVILNIEKFIVPFLYFAAIYFGITYLKIETSTQNILNTVIIIFATFFAIRFISAVINYFIKYYWEKREGHETDVNLKGISTFVSLFIWAIGLVFLLDNLGFEISAVVAGLGIGGIAIALAAQTVLGDLFSYFVIFFDRPFQIGDFIIVDNKMGVVEKVGIKTTRISSLSGEQIVFSNTDLTNSRLHNYKKMLRRRVLFKIGVVYQTPLKTLKEIPALLKGIVEENDAAAFDRSHLKGYGDFSIDFEIVYYVIGPDYIKFMDIQQNINFRIYEEFEKRGIEFAYPTQTLFLNKENGMENIKSEIIS